MNDRQQSRTSVFSIWLYKLSQRAEEELGIDIYDLRDVDYYQFFEDGLTVSEMIERLREFIVGR